MQYLDRLKEVSLIILSATFLLTIIMPVLGYTSELKWHPFQSGAAEMEPEIIIEEETTDHLLLSYRFSGIYVAEVKPSNDTFQQVFLTPATYQISGTAGDPAIPFYASRIYLPDGMKGSVSVVSTEWQKYPDSINLYPRQVPSRDDGSPPPPFLFNKQTYLANTPQPEELAVINAPQGWGGILVAGLSLSPVRYLPAAQELSIASRITIRIDFEPGLQRPLRPSGISSRMQHLHQVSLLNPPQPDLPEFNDFDENTPIRALFVLKEEALETATPWINFHDATGLRAEVLLADDLNGPEDLKQIVREYYLEGLEYLFLIGDSYFRDWDVPMYLWDPNDPGWQDPQSTASYSDSWFVCLDDPDENDFEDHLPELAVGRLTYESPDDLDELQLQIEKILEYLTWSFEDPNDTAWLNRGVFVASDARQDGQPVYLDCKRDIENFQYGLPTPEFIAVYGDDDNATVNTVVAEVNDPGIGFFNYRGHGTEIAMYRPLQNRSIDRDIIWQFENRNRPFISVSSACLNANVATRRSNCVLENLQKHTGGSVSTHGSVISTYTPGNTFFDQRIFRAWFDDGVYDLGYASNLASTEMVLNWANDWFAVIGRMNTRAFIWLGDPALQYRLGAPFELNVDIPNEIVVATEWFDVTFTNEEEEPVADAVICVRGFDDEIIQTVYADADGRARIDFDPLLPDAGLLTWTAYHRNSRPVFGEILAADAFGIIAGFVIDAETQDSVAGARLELNVINSRTVSDENGFYVFNGVPQRDGYQISVTADTYLSHTIEEIGVRDDDTTRVNINLLYNELTLDSLEISLHIEAGAEQRRDLTLSNSGNGPLRWQMEIPVEDVVGFDEEFSRELTEDLGDTRLNGVAFAENRFFVTGGNNNDDPNFIYILDEAGNLIDMFNQPGGSFGTGFHDLAWTGEYLVSSFNDEVLVFDLEGNLITSFIGPYNPNLALTVDHEGNLWIGNNQQSLIKVDLDGRVLREIANVQAVRGLAWDSLEPDGFNLMMMVLGENNRPTLFQTNVETGETRLAADLSMQEGEIPADALFVTEDFNQRGRSVVGLINQGAQRFLRVWSLDHLESWLTIEPLAGLIPAQDEQVLELQFDATQFSRDQILSTMITIVTDGRTPVVEIPVTMEVDDGAGVVSRDYSEAPEQFSVTAAYPNPFNAQTRVEVYLPQRGQLTGKLLDLNGREISTFYDQVSSAGFHTLEVRAQHLATGIYFITLDGPGIRHCQKIALVR